MNRTLSLSLATLSIVALAGCDARPVKLLNTNMEIDDTGWSELPFELITSMEVTFRIRVVQGNAADVRIGYRADPTSYIRDLSRDQLREHQATVIMERGKYAVRAKESSEKNAEGKAPDKATLHIWAEGKPARVLRR